MNDIKKSMSTHKGILANVLTSKRVQKVVNRKPPNIEIAAIKLPSCSLNEYPFQTSNVDTMTGKIKNSKKSFQ